NAAVVERSHRLPRAEAPSDGPLVADTVSVYCPVSMVAPAATRSRSLTGSHRGIGGCGLGGRAGAYAATVIARRASIGTRGSHEWITRRLIHPDAGPSAGITTSPRRRQCVRGMRRTVVARQAPADRSRSGDRRPARSA